MTATLSQKVLSSITVMSFAGVSLAGTGGSGAVGESLVNSAPSGAPFVTLTTTGANSWVIGVGNDFDNALARSVGSGQTLVHQDLTGTGDTYWVQIVNDSVAASGTMVSILDTGPTGDQYNLAAVEVLAQP